MNYPNKSKIEKTTFINYAHRGMTLESDINSSNKYYLDNDIAVIYKKPTPIKVVKVNYNNRINTKIVEAYYEVPSTTDYNGIYKGKYIDFEAKETKSKTAFNLNNIHKHQIVHLEKVLKHGGISFLIIRFTTINKTFLLFTEDFSNYIKDNDRKSIPLSYIEEKGYLLKDSYNPIIDYIKIIDNYIGDKNEKKI
ncbi:MAG: Holliday junction resolvase RecU [Bacilli bacterium]|nr:Holliday junction resolvase RecU [Bacilli bacterium]